MQMPTDGGRRLIAAERDKVLRHFQLCADRQVSRLEKRAKKANEAGYDDLAAIYADRIDLFKKILSDVTSRY